MYIVPRTTTHTDFLKDEKFFLIDMHINPIAKQQALHSIFFHFRKTILCGTILIYEYLPVISQKN